MQWKIDEIPDRFTTEPICLTAGMQVNSDVLHWHTVVKMPDGSRHLAPTLGQLVYLDEFVDQRGLNIKVYAYLRHACPTLFVGVKDKWSVEMFDEKVIPAKMRDVAWALNGAAPPADRRYTDSDYEYPRVRDPFAEEPY